eukprot:17333-Heterococcus_DN1.PRE.2
MAIDCFAPLPPILILLHHYPTAIVLLIKSLQLVLAPRDEVIASLQAEIADLRSVAAATATAASNSVQQSLSAFGGSVNGSVHGSVHGSGIGSPSPPASRASSSIRGGRVTGGQRFGQRSGQPPSAVGDDTGSAHGSQFYE